MTAVGAWRATYAPGDWLVLCGPTSVVVLEPPGAGWTELVRELWEQVVRAGSLTDLASRLAGYGLDTMPSFGALFWTADGMRSLVRGAVRVVDPATGRVVADGEGVQTWSEVGLAALSTARLETDTEDDPDALLLPLVVGAVRASAVVLDARPEARLDSPQLAARGAPSSTGQGGGRAPSAAAPASSEVGATEGAATSRTGPETDAIELPTTEAMAAPLPGPGAVPTGSTLPLAEGADASERDERDEGDEAPTEPQPGPAEPSARPVGVPGGPTVLAVVCPYGHPNPAGATRCRDCGVRVLDTEPRPLPQPALSTLRVSDGTQLALDRLVRVGRAPVGRGDVASRLLTVPSPSHDISRTHLEIVPDGWRITVKDLNSTNGTVLIGPDGGRRALPPGEPVVVALGSELELADGVSILLDLPQ